MSKRIVIVLTGAAGSGKSTAAQLLASEYGFARLRFAGPLKAMMHCLGLDERHTDGELKEVPCDILGGKTPRHAMQTIGTEWGRGLIDANLWVNAGIAQMDMVKEEVNVLFDDCRFPNELAKLEEREDIIVQSIRVVRPSGTVFAPVKPRRWWEFWLENPAVHVSETFKIETDYLLNNTGTVEELRQEVRELVNQIARAFPQVLPFELRVERMAQEIYDSWSYMGDGVKPAWTPGGNSRMQDHARKQAAWIIKAK